MTHIGRSTQAVIDFGIIPFFTGVLIHDCWHVYFTFKMCLHSLCNAHHIRELRNLAENLNIEWAAKMMKFLYTVHKMVQESGGKLSDLEQQLVRECYKNLIDRAELETPEETKIPGKRGRQKRSTARNLLERLIKYEDEILRFMTDVNVPFTNNFGEFCIRMAKVHDKISGCFRSWRGSYMYCRIRGYILTCQRHGLEPMYALELLFSDRLPDFVDLNEIETIESDSQETRNEASSDDDDDDESTDDGLAA
jgi:transposase